MSARFMILSSGFGDGHNAAAKGLALAARIVDPESYVTIHDMVLERYPNTGKGLQKGYLWTVTRFPWLWLKLYGAMDRGGPMAKRTPFLAGLIRRLKELIQEHKPDALISTYPLYPILVERLRAQGFDTPPIFTVITDSLTVNRMWLASESDLYFTADPFSADVVQEMGVPAEKIVPAGFAVNPVFESIAAGKGPETSTRRILFLPHSKEAKVIAELEALVPLLRSGVHLHLALGRNKSRLYHSVTRFCDLHPDLPIQVSGWLDDIPQQLARHHLLISKAGGATTHEAISAGIPFLVDSLIPGQEEGNAELLTRYGGGRTTLTPEALAAAAGEILAPGLEEWKRMRANLLRHGKPDGARAIIDRVITELGSPRPAVSC